MKNDDFPAIKRICVFGVGGVGGYFGGKLAHGMHGEKAAVTRYISSPGART
jgi:hypothetical protein